MKKIALLFIAVFSFVAMGAQPLAKRVSLNYKNEELGDVLAAISTHYDVRFSYSPDYVPVNQKISVSVVNQPLAKALDDMLEETTIAYVGVGEQVVLKVDKQKKAQLTKLETLPGKVRQTSPIYPERSAANEEPPRIRRSLEREVPAIDKPQLGQLSGGNRPNSMQSEGFNPVMTPPVEVAENKDDNDKRLAQISLLPFLSTNARRSKDLINNVSVNLLWGNNGGVEGFEVGGFVNTITYDVKGMQLAGFGNVVGRDVVGTQVGGLFNVAKGEVIGVQAGGLFNVAGSGYAIQASGLFNVSRGDYAGLQAASLFNVSRGAADGLQVSGFFNASRGKTKSQIASLFNVAGDLQWGQIALFFNRGKRVEGFQFGLINVSDTISGIPIGVLNIVKKGYNRVEIAGAETIYTNFALKLGAYSFYNIFQYGLRWGDNALPNKKPVSSSFGYGIGTSFKLSHRTLMNLEVVTHHVNEREKFTSELNQLNQFRLLFDLRVGRRASFFGGPTLNRMSSRLYDPDSDTYGTTLAPKTFYDITYHDGKNVKMWIGFSAGIRL